MLKEYVTLENREVATEGVIERSRFIGYAIGVECEADALAFIAMLRKRHYDATHNCFAYVTDEATRYSDDGEPQGTAGMPILDVLKKKGLTRACVVVTRYFGGIKLGAGGLTRAYGGFAAKAVSAANTVEYRLCTIYDIHVPYTLLKLFEQTALRFGTVTNKLFSEDVVVTVAVANKDAEAFEGEVINISNGKIVPKGVETLIGGFKGTDFG